MLKPGGRAAVVLPDGTLCGEGVKTRIKEQLLTESDVHTIVRLPNAVFAPYWSIKRRSVPRGPSPQLEGDSRPLRIYCTFLFFDVRLWGRRGEITQVMPASYCWQTGGHLPRREAAR